MYTILFFSAGAIRDFFNEPQLAGIIRVLAIVLIIDSFGSIHRTMLTKKIDFKTQTKINIASSVISGIAAVIFASIGFGVWSLVIRTFLMQLIQSFLLCLYNRWIPSLTFKADSFRRLFGFGWKLLLSGLIDTLYSNLYYLIIGRMFSAVELGYYTNAQKLRDTVSQSITVSVQKVSYPVLSSIKEDEEKLRAVYKKIIKSSVFIIFPLMIGLAVIGDPLIRLIFGPKWVNSIAFFQILCFAGMLFPLHVINLDILKVKGRSDLFLGLEIVKKIIGLLSIVIVIWLELGITGLIWAAVFNSYISYFINSYFSEELLSYSTKEQVKDIIPAFAATGLMGISVYLLGTVLPGDNLVRLTIQSSAGIMIYLSLCKIIRIEEFKSLYDFIKNNFLNKLPHSAS